MRVALAQQIVEVQWREKGYPLRLDQLLVSGPLLELLTMAKDGAEALFFVDPFILFVLSGITYPFDEGSTRFIEDGWRKARIVGELEASTQGLVTPALEALFALRAWCKGNDMCLAHWNAVTSLNRYIFSRKMVLHALPLPPSLYSLIAIFRAPPKKTAFELYINFFYARDTSDDFARTGFVITTCAFCRNIPVAEAEDEVLFTIDLEKTNIAKWRYYDLCIQVCEKMTVWAKKQIGIPYTTTSHKKSKGMRSMLEFLHDFLKESNIILDMKPTIEARICSLWCRFLWRLVSEDTNPEADPAHIVFY